MTQEELKRRAALQALEEVEPLLTPDAVVGIGTGSTANLFIEALEPLKGKFDAAVSSSEASAARLRDVGIHVIDLNAAPAICVYVDGADEVNPTNELIKGGGGALTREKIVAASSEKFLCIVDESKQVDVLGAFPLPIEVVPMARGLVARTLVDLGGQPELRADFVTDNGNVIIDVWGLSILSPGRLEQEINQIPGVVCCGIFSANRADRVLVAGANGIVGIDRPV